jgi:hypothetical protein
MEITQAQHCQLVALIQHSSRDLAAQDQGLVALAQQRAAEETAIIDSAREASKVAERRQQREVLAPPEPLVAMH